MAQWVGQYTSNTHSTKVTDFESALENAVCALKASSEELKPRKAKAVKKLAEKVLNARLKMIKAKLYEAVPVESGMREEMRTHIEHLQAAEAELRSAGVEGILRDFGASEIIENGLRVHPHTFTSLPGVWSAFTNR